MVMGDLVLTEEEVNPVMKHLVTITCCAPSIFPYTFILKAKAIRLNSPAPFAQRSR